MQVQESVNPTGPERDVVNTDAQDVSSGAGVTSFDELESIDKGIVDTRKSELKTEAKAKDELQAETGTKKEAVETVTEETKVPEITKQDFKTLKLRNGETDLDLRLDSLVPIKVDGKLEKVQLQDLLSNYSGKVAWDKKFTEVDKVRQQALQDLKTVKQAETEIAELHKLTTEGKAHEAIYRIAELMGANPINVLNDLRQQFLTQLGLEDVIPEEYQARLVEEERDYYKSKLERESQKYQNEAQLKNTETRMNDVIEKFGMTADQFAEVYYNMRETEPTRSLEPEDVAIEYANREAMKYISGVINEVNPNLTSQEQADAYKHIRYFVENTSGVTHDDIFELASSVYGNAHAKSVSKKIHETKPFDSAKKTEKQKTDPWSFDDLV